MSNGGLANVTVADTELSKVDGENGVLYYRGYDILDLGVKACFEEVAYLMWYGKLPNKAELEAFNAEMSGYRALPPILIQMMEDFPNDAHPMAVLRTCVSALGTVDPEADNLSTENVQRQAKYLVAVLPSIVAAWERVRTGNAIIEPRPDLDHASNFLYMLTGEEPADALREALDAYLICLIDHGFNASTFASRVTFATISDIYSAVTAGVGTLKGNAHGRANQLAMEQFAQAYDTGNIEQWYKDARENKVRIMGIGHRVYKVADPRGKVLGPLAQKMSASSSESYWYDVAAQIAGLARQDDYFIDRNLYPNVDYYSSIVLYMLGMPTDQFTCAFAMSRMVGWTAHVLEQLANNRLIRPKANYVGPIDLDFPPLEERA